MSPHNSESPTSLYDEDGLLDLTLFTEDGVALLIKTQQWLQQINRPMFLPIDLLVVLVDQPDSGVRTAIARAARGSEDFEDLRDQLEILAQRVERRTDAEPELHLNSFSLGFMGILDDAWTWVLEAGREKIDSKDIARVVRWRAELQESASVRWAIRQLAQPGGENLFEADGGLRREGFTVRTWAVLQSAMRLAAHAGMSFLGTPHLVAAMVVSPSTVLWKAAEQGSVSPNKLRDELVRIVGTRSPAQPEFSLGRRSLTPRLVRMIVAAGQGAEGDGRRIDEADLTVSFLEDGGSSLDLIRAFRLELPIRSVLSEAKRSRSRSPEHAIAGFGRSVVEIDAHAESGSPTLELVGRDLSKEAAAGTLPEVLGRDAELRRVTNVLLRSEQRNPLLTGEPGVGKTALAVALAQRIHEGKVPKRLRNMRVVEINGASLVGGTSYRGELEARIKSLLAEAENNVILFIDEAHAVFAPRLGSGQPAEVPNHFKSALASGKIAVVAATTETEYHQWIEQDPALKRRFERIEVPELSGEITRQILVKLAPQFEKDYDVPISPEALDAAIDLSQRFVPEQSLPDKAKKLLMDAAIAVSSEMAIAAGPDDDEPNPLVNASDTPHKRIVGRVDVARLVAQKTGVPLDRIVNGSMSWWVGLGDRLKKHVTGQDAALDRVASSLVASRLNSVGRHRPQAVFVLAGPPGVGKNKLATGLAREVFGNERSVIRLEMSDFHGSHSITRLIGSPPGYVGYSDEDSLVTPLRRRPSSVILLSGFDLAHPQVQERLIRVFEEGEILDTRGMRADARHAIFVLTVDTDDNLKSGIGFGAEGQKDVTLKRLIPDLHDRLRGRAYEFVLFRGVGDDSGELGHQLLDERITDFIDTLRHEYDIKVTIGLEVIEQMHQAVAKMKDVRELETLFRDMVIEPASQDMLRGPIGDTITIGSTPPSADDVDQITDPRRKSVPS